MPADSAAKPQQANWLDRLVAAVDPVRGLRRATAREVLHLQQKRAYEGASKADGWRPKRPSASADADHVSDAAELRARSRALWQNVPYVRRGLESRVSSLVGTGITPRSLSRAARKLDDLHAQWVPMADYDGRLCYHGITRLAALTADRDGEVLIRLRTPPPSRRVPVPLQLQVLEIDWIDSSKTESLPDGGSIVGGKQMDERGAVTGYWLYSHHPHDATRPRGGGQRSQFVPASQIIHYYSIERPGQGRGFPRAANVIARVRDLHTYEDAEIARKNLETRLSVLASGDLSQMALTETAGLASQLSSTGNLGTLGSGGITQVPPGMNLTVVDPKAAPGYVEYMRYQLHLVAAGLGVTYEMLTGDMLGVNFSSARVALLEFRRDIEQEQWLGLIPRLCAPLWRWWIDAAVLQGVIARPDYAVDWSTPKWDYVNPEQDVAADLAEISGGLSSISEKLRRRGYKPEMVYAELKQDLDRLRADGTLDVMLMLQTRKPLDASGGGAGTSSSRGGSAATQQP